MRITVRPENDAPAAAVSAGRSCSASGNGGSFHLTVADEDDPESALALSAASSNEALVPAEGVTFGGSGVSRAATIAASDRATGTATIMLRVSDGRSSSSVTLTVQAAGNGEDMLTGSPDADLLLGQNGRDALAGGGAADVLCGGAGRDRLRGGPGADHFGGGRGDDMLVDFADAEQDTQD